MTEERRKWIVIWPLYFDKSKSRSEGRRVPKELSIERPTIDDIVLALKKIGLKYIVEKDKKHPSTWFESSGRVLVEKKFKKTELLRRIAEILVKEKSHKKR